MRDAAEIADLYKTRENQHTQEHAAMAQIAEVYNGDTDIPLPELSRDEKPAVPNLVRQGIDQEAMRVASPAPNVEVPVVGNTNTAENRADLRRRAHLGNLEANNVDVLLRLRARHLLGFARSPCVLLPDRTLRGARWEAIDPRASYPHPHTQPGTVLADDFVWAVRRTLKWVRDAGYSDAYARLAAPVTQAGRDPGDTPVTVINHVDSTGITQAVVREAMPMLRASEHVELLQQIENRAGVPLATCPTSITLDKVQSQFEGMLGMYQARAKMMALAIIATQRNVFSDWWLEEREGATETAEVVNPPDPYTGEVGVVRGGQLKPDRPDSQFNTIGLIDHIEGGERAEGPVPAELGGQSATNLRTGRRGAQVLSSGIDFYIEEAQTLLARSLQSELEMSSLVEHAWYGGQEKSFYVNWKGAKGHVKYDPAKLWDPEQNDVRVTHAMAGVDVDSLIIGAGQRVGMETLSKKTFQQIDPMVEDPQAETANIQAERITAAFLAKLEADANDPESALTALDLASMVRKVRSGTDLFDAADEIQQEAQERLAEQQQAPPDPMSPEAMPGPLTEGGGPQIRPAADTVPGLQNLGDAMFAARAPQMTLASEA